jgi:hypothetical protein
VSHICEPDSASISQPYGSLDSESAGGTPAVWRLSVRRSDDRSQEQIELRLRRPRIAAIRLLGNAWNEFIPFLDYDVEIRTVLCSTNAIASLTVCNS